MKKLLFSTLMIGIFFISGCAPQDGAHQQISWEELVDKKSGDEITIQGYLTTAIQYPESIFKKNEFYLYLSPNNDYPLQGQIPLIVNSPATCSAEVAVSGVLIFREGLSGMGSSKNADYPLIKVDKMTCGG